MNVVNTIARVLKGGKRTDEDEEDRLVIRLKEADYTNDRLERRIIELADGNSIAEILRRLTEGLDQVWVTWIKKHYMSDEAIQRLEQRGFIRIENRPKSLRSCD